MDDNDNQNRTDPLQPADDIFNPNVDEERLEEDNDSPASDPDDVSKSMPSDFPATDDTPDEHEEYDEGRENATADNFAPEEGQKVFPVSLEHEDNEDDTDEEEE